MNKEQKQQVLKELHGMVALHRHITSVETTRPTEGTTHFWQAMGKQSRVLVTVLKNA